MYFFANSILMKLSMVLLRWDEYFGVITCVLGDTALIGVGP